MTITQGLLSPETEEQNEKKAPSLITRLWASCFSDTKTDGNPHGPKGKKVPHRMYHSRGPSGRSLRGRG